MAQLVYEGDISDVDCKQSLFIGSAKMCVVCITETQNETTKIVSTPASALFILWTDEVRFTKRKCLNLNKFTSFLSR